LASDAPDHKGDGSAGSKVVSGKRFVYSLRPRVHYSRPANKSAGAHGGANRGGSFRVRVRVDAEPSKEGIDFWHRLKPDIGSDIQPRDYAKPERVGHSRGPRCGAYQFSAGGYGMFSHGD
jgi:hypothetical protein